VSKLKVLHIIAFILLIVGGLNWGLFGLFHLDLVAYLPVLLAKIVYVLVGVAALLEIFTHKTNCKACVAPAAMPKTTI